ncbi:chemotaxis protein CheB [Pseudomonas sp. UL073]|uniref:protein-glutamate methylesterase n=1 Tax=Zestomonas insulae TaxID=2809017 RepID=A0ABS2IJP7_9GAMM|nr:chemotaxis protein CheB [Pseudomonas insulae]MBM7062564.1 chemotaxis protein CheB [Pseudomonas insulae]
MKRAAQVQLGGRPHAPLAALVIGASAGGIDALLRLLGALPADYRLPIACVLHLPDQPGSLLAALFQRQLALRVKDAEDKEQLAAGTLYFAPPGYHLSIEQDHSFSLSREEPRHFSRPSIDFLFESAADAYQERLAGVLLTGANEDGAAGLLHIQQRGGLTLVQEPADAQVPTMPAAALALLQPDFLLPLDAMPALLAELDSQPC